MQSCQANKDEAGQAAVAEEWTWVFPVVVVKYAFVTCTLRLLPVESIKGEGKGVKISYPVKERKTRMC